MEVKTTIVGFGPVSFRQIAKVFFERVFSSSEIF